MTRSYDIKYIKSKEINKQKWDNCISNAKNGLLYAYSFYLDHMCDNWDALVMNDYEVVMPLPWNKKYGIAYIYQPFLTAQLGVFGNTITADIVEVFINSIPSKFKLIELSLNSANNIDSSFLAPRANYTLDLNIPYEVIFANYRDNIKRNIKKAKQLGCTASKDFDPEKVIKLALQQMQHYDKVVNKNVDKFRSLYHFLQEQKKAITYGIELNNRLIASCIFFFSPNRAYYILVGNHPDGKTIGASHMLIDAFIKDHTGQQLILDFEGSDIRKLAFFYSSFGAKQEIYPFLKINCLPFYLKCLKK